MESLFSIIIILFIVFALIRRVKSSSQDIQETREKFEKNAKALTAGTGASVGSRPAAPTRVKPVKKAPVSSFDAEVGSTDGGMKKSSREGLSIKDDRTNDWLAHQMRYERQSLGRLNDMFGFIIHKNNGCDAELLREFHHANCSAEGIDTAKGR